MSRYLVAIIDGTKARFLTLNPVEFEGYESGPTLVEHDGLHSSEKEMHGQDLWANTKTGRNRGTSGQAHGYDDHRNNHIVEFERRFAQSITRQIMDMVNAHEARRLILVAEPQILGIMREATASCLPPKLKVHEVAKDLCRMTVKELQRYLAERSLIPAFNRVTI